MKMALRTAIKNSVCTSLSWASQIGDFNSNKLLKNISEPCHSDAETCEAEESRSETKGTTRFLIAAGSSE